MLKLFLEPPIEQPVMMGADISEVDKTCDPVVKNGKPGDTEHASDILADRTSEGCIEMCSSTKGQELFQGPNWRQSWDVISIFVVSRSVIFGLLKGFDHLRERFVVSPGILESVAIIERMAAVPTAQSFGESVSEGKFEPADGLESERSKARIAFIELYDVVIRCSWSERLVGLVSATEEVDPQSLVSDGLDLARCDIRSVDDQPSGS